MGLTAKRDPDAIRRTLYWYNMIPNLVWSALNLTPISIYCFNRLDGKLFYIFLAVSFIPGFLKNSFLDKLQPGNTPEFYRRLGVQLINKVAQNGVIVTKLIRRKYPDYKIVKPKKSSIAGLINQTYLFEKFHLILFLYFNLVMIYAFIKGHLIWACVILFCNVAYNIYPNLLQQYIRIKLVLFNQRMNA